MTGRMVDDLKTVMTGKETKWRLEYCATLLRALEMAQGPKRARGGDGCCVVVVVVEASVDWDDMFFGLFWWLLLLCLFLHWRTCKTMVAVVSATVRLRKTQKMAEGKSPEGLRGVGWKGVVMSNSCK